jgi:hypothetical protein
MASKKSETAQFILLPVRGFRDPDMTRIDAAAPAFVAASTARLRAGAGATRNEQRRPSMKVLHSLYENGPKLVEMGPADVAALRVSNPGVKALPVVKYELARIPKLVADTPAATAGARLATRFQVSVVDAKTNKPLKGAQVAAFTNLKDRVGANGTSTSNGSASLSFTGKSVKLQALVVYGPARYWGIGKRSYTLKSGETLALQPIDLSTPDFVAQLYGKRQADGGEGVKVGLIDSGVDATHPDLHVAGGVALVVAEHDAGGGGPAAKDGEHGTHVAGIIASNGSTPPAPPRTRPGKRGIAPKVTLMSYRVFPNSGAGADNYDIMRAIDQGVKDGCDLLNLSLETSTADEAVHAAVKDAFDKGTVCIAAAGNGERKPVAYPAAWDIVVAVSSLGKKGTYPASSSEVLDEVAPYARTDRKIYVSSFSNVGPEIDIAGPGEGVVSTLPGGAYGVLSGTSMACPAVTGVLASMLSAKSAILKMPRDRNRSIAIVGVLTAAARTLGFIQPLEGVGLVG